MTEGSIYIGTSGWNYPMWSGILYPEDVFSKDYLKFYSQHFNTVEINTSFYHFPRITTYKNWYGCVPEGFVFSVKVHRSITHIKKLIDVETEWEKFIEGAKVLREKLGVVLFQFPASFRYDEERFERIERFFHCFLEKETKLKTAFEFRHTSWDNEKIKNLFEKYNAGWVIANSSRYPEIEKITADFVYIRMHGPEELFASEYSKEQLKNLAAKIKKWKKKRDIFVYFNNDFYGYAVENARQLKELLS